AACRLHATLYSIILQTTKAGVDPGRDPIDVAFRLAFPHSTTGPAEAEKRLLRELEQTVRSRLGTRSLRARFYDRYLHESESVKFVRSWVSSRAGNRLG